jgi:hypothetical protein
VNRANVIITGIFALTLVGAGYWFVAHFERHEETVSTGLQAEARRNPLLAVGRMLRILGVSARELEAGTWKQQLEGSRGTLVLASRSWTLSNEDLESLVQWIADGGHLVTAPETLARPASFWNRDDDTQAHATIGDSADATDAIEGTASAGALLSKFGIVRTDAPLSSKERAAAVPTRINDTELPVTYATRVRLLVDHENFVARARDEHGLCFIEMRYGRGRLSVLCSLNSLSNLWINEQRNATFAWHLLEQQGEELPVWFLFDTDMPALYRWLWQNMPVAVIAAAALLVLWLWSLMRRSGPLIDEEITGSRRTLEHIDASGRFIWRYDTGGALLDGMRDALNKVLEQRYPGWLQLPEATLYERLAHKSNLDPTRVFRALADTPKKRAQFVTAVRDLQRLRETL